jgi:hypothetical protein
MNPNEIGYLFLTGFFILLIIGTYSLAKDDGYEKGQKDAIKGVIRYTLVEWQDGEREWRKDFNPDPKLWRQTFIIIKEYPITKENI